MLNDEGLERLGDCAVAIALQLLALEFVFFSGAWW
jgi:hypothetical protein